MEVARGVGGWVGGAEAGKDQRKGKGNTRKERKQARTKESKQERKQASPSCVHIQLLV